MSLTILALMSVIGRTSPATRVTLGDLRKLLPADMRLTPAPASAAWKLVVKASGARPEPKSIDALWSDGISLAAKDLIPKKDRPKLLLPEDNATDLLRLWWRPHDRQLIQRTERLLTRYQARLTSLRSAIQYSDWTPPLPPDNYEPGPRELVETSFPVTSGLREMVRVVLLQARLQTEQRRYREAEASIFLARSIGEHLCGRPANLIWYITGLGCLSTVSEQAVRFARLPSFPEGTIIRLTKQLVAFDQRGQMRQVLIGELNRFSLPYIAFAAGNAEHPSGVGTSEQEAKVLLAGHPHPFDPEETTQFAVTMFRSRIDNLDSGLSDQIDIEKQAAALTAGIPSYLIPDFDNHEEAGKLTPEQLRAGRLALRAVDNPIGRIIASGFAGSGIGETDTGRIGEARERARALVLASNLYRRKTGHWPESLSALGPREGIEHPLVDPLTGTAFRYDLKNLKVGSLGFPRAEDRRGFSYDLVPPTPSVSRSPIGPPPGFPSKD